MKFAMVIRAGTSKLQLAPLQRLINTCHTNNGFYFLKLPVVMNQMR